MAASPANEEIASVRFVQRILLAVLLLGLLGTGAELVLLNHVKKFAQWPPLVLIVLGLVAIGWHTISHGRASGWVVQVLMFAFIFAGLAGFYLHFQGSAEFKLESNPTLKGWELFWAAMSASAAAASAGCDDPARSYRLGVRQDQSRVSRRKRCLRVVPVC